MVCDSTARQKQHTRRAPSIIHPKSIESLTLLSLFSHFFRSHPRHQRHFTHAATPVATRTLKFKTQLQHSNETNLPLVRPSSSFTPSDFFFLPTFSQSTRTVCLLTRPHDHHHHFAIPTAPGLGECQGTDGDRRPDSATSGQAGGSRSRGWKQERLLEKTRSIRTLRGRVGGLYLCLSGPDRRQSQSLTCKLKKKDENKRETASSLQLHRT